MPRASPIQTAFNAGEWSPRMAGRVDLPGWGAACETLLNFLITAEGPASHRGGTYYVASTKFQAKRSRLKDFRFSTVQTYILEFGDLYIRVYKDYGQVLSGAPALPVEIVTPYAEADLPALSFCQSADVLYICHNGFPVHKLTRTSHVDWTLATVNFSPPATEEAGYTPVNTISLTLSAVTGTGVTVTASAATFLAADVGRQVKSGNALATITDYTDTTHVTADVVNDFASTAVAAAGWSITGSPVATLTPSVAGPIGATATLTLGAAGWHNSDVGRYVKVNGGFAVLTSVSSTTVAKGRVLRAMDNKTAADGGTWSLTQPAWSAANGYPACATFYQQRLFFACTAAKPTTFWGSVTGDFENFSQGADDDAAVDFTLDTDQVNAIQWMVGTRALLIGTTGAEFTVTGSATKPKITPDNIQVLPQSARGSAALPALLVGNVLMFAQRSKKKVRQYRYNYADDAYVSPDITLKARHITGTGIVNMAYAQEPEGILWCARGDGLLAGLTFDDDEQVVGWHRHMLGGAFASGNAMVESIAVMPSPDGAMDDLWIQVKRTVGGQTVRTIEYLTVGLGDADPQEDGYFVDCGLTYDGNAPTDAHPEGEGPADSIDGLEHLIGQTVKICADGATHPDRVVDADGAVALDGAYTKVHVGLYAEAELLPMPMEGGAADGTAQGKLKRLENIGVRFNRTLGGKLVAIDELGRRHVERIDFRTAGDLLGKAPPLFTGDKIVDNPGGWDTKGQAAYVQDEPLPATVICMMPNVVTNKL